MSNRIKDAAEALRIKHREREDAVTGILLSVVAGKNTVLIGPETAGKDALAADVCAAVYGKNAERYIISASTQREELLSRIAKDTSAMMLNDVFAANSGTLNAIADIISDNKMTLFASSADGPSESDEAFSLYDLFLIRVFVDSLRSDETFLSSIVDKKNETALPAIPFADIEAVRRTADRITVDDDVLAAILSLRDLFKNTGRSVSDLRWKGSVQMMKIAAAAAGEKSVSVSFIPLLQHTLWDWPEDIDEIKTAVFAVCTPGGLDLNGLHAEADQLLKVSVRSKGAVDESAGFPRIIHCYDCNSSFPTLRRLKEHSISRPKHTYADPNIAADSGSHDYVKYSYEGLVTLLSSKYNWDIFRKSEASEKEMLLNEAKALKKKKKELEDSHDKDRDKLTKDLEKNFWLTDRDKKDIMAMFNLRSARITEIGSLISDVEYILE